MNSNKLREIEIKRVQLANVSDANSYPIYLKGNLKREI